MPTLMARIGRGGRPSVTSRVVRVPRVRTPGPVYAGGRMPGSDLVTAIADGAEGSGSGPMTPAEFARERHGSQLRKGTDLPYIIHPEGVARILAQRYPGRADLEAAGWLHDTIEDTATTPDELEARFGPEVRRLVEAVTQRGWSRWHPPTDPDVMRLKAADALDNLTFTVEGLRAGEPVFRRFKQGPGKIDYWRRISEAADRLLGSEPLAADLRAAVDDATPFARAARATAMRGSRLAVALIVGLAGLVWIGQGTDVIGGSAMSGSGFWAVIGVIAVAGAAAIVARERRRSARR
jgi:hypothetical protein